MVLKNLEKMQHFKEKLKEIKLNSNCILNIYYMLITDHLLTFFCHLFRWFAVNYVLLIDMQIQERL